MLQEWKFCSREKITQTKSLERTPGAKPRSKTPRVYRPLGSHHDMDVSFSQFIKDVSLYLTIIFEDSCRCKKLGELSEL